MQHHGDWIPIFSDAWARSSDWEAATTAAVFWSLLRGTFEPHHERGDVYSYPFQTGQTWRCMLVGIGDCRTRRWCVGLDVFALEEMGASDDCDEDDIPPLASRIERAQKGWNRWLEDCVRRAS